MLVVAENNFRILPPNLLQIFYKIIFNFLMIAISIVDPDNNFISRDALKQ